MPELGEVEITLQARAAGIHTALILGPEAADVSTSNPFDPSFLPEGYDEPEDTDIMEANAAGMDAYNVGQSIHDNPYQGRLLRDAWHQGWTTAQHNAAEIDQRGYVPEADGRLLYTRSTKPRV